MFIAGFGTPIFNPSCTEIWAYWSGDHTFENSSIKFSTVSDLLGVEPLEGMATRKGTGKYVHYTNGSWIAGNGTVQADFKENKLFIVNKMSGSDSCSTAIKIILNNPIACTALSESTLNELRKAAGVVQKHARKPNIPMWTGFDPGKSFSSARQSGKTQMTMTLAGRTSNPKPSLLIMDDYENKVCKQPTNHSN